MTGPGPLLAPYAQRLRRHRAPLLDLLLWAAVTAPLLLFHDIPGWARAAGFPVLAAAVALSRRAPLAALVLPAALSLATTPELFTNSFSVALLALSYLLGRRSADVRRALLFFAALCAAGLALVLARGDTTLWEWFTLVATVLFALDLPWLLGRFRRQQAELVRTGWELAARMEREKELVADRTRLRERSRIAGDMHDSLGHDLSLLAVRAAALQVQPGLSDDARAQAAELRQAAADATARLRQILGVLREDADRAPTEPAAAPPEPLETLIARATASGVAVNLVHRAPPGLLPAELPPMTAHAVHRVVQESLTNATKHAPGAPVTVTLTRNADTVEVTVENPEPKEEGERTDATGTGSGLVGLDERVRLLGGTLRARRPLDGGFEVAACLPLTPDADPTTTSEDGSPETDTSQEALAQARRRVRRRLLDALWIPLAATVVLGLLMLGFNLYTSYRSVLDATTYGRLAVGTSLSRVEPRLPAYEFDDEDRPFGAPADPPDTDECRYYRTEPFDNSPVYRLCFTAGHLSHKDKLSLS
ncbi:sensor histidine kinase [Streptomyces sp. NPDC048172]|uniref:sensor histidine kinase n=1 Tax=Streptomyces sp. NPDC048172 TaxID=3365505 RepID=UPI00371B8298